MTTNEDFVVQMLARYDGRSITVFASTLAKGRNRAQWLLGGETRYGAAKIDPRHIVLQPVDPVSIRNQIERRTKELRDIYVGVTELGLKPESIQRQANALTRQIQKLEEILGTAEL